jgi:drug/metabolite transporter (DMT)-like permease
MPQQLSSLSRASTLTPTTAALAVLCCLLWAGAYVTGKYAIGTEEAPGFGPFRTAFFRFGLAGVLLGIWGLWRDPTSLKIAREDWPAFGRLALLGMCLTYVFNYPGLDLSSGTAAALIMATEPVWIAILAVLFLRERLTLARLMGIVLGLTGAFLVVLSTQKPDAVGTTAGGKVMLGNILLVLSLLWESGAVLTVKKLTARYKGQAIVTYEFLVGSLMLAPFAAWEMVQRGPLHPAPSAWMSFAYLLVACTLVAYTLWFRLLAQVDASEITVFIFLQPVIGTLIGIFWLHDPFTPVTFAGAALVLAGVWGITRQGQKQEKCETISEIPEIKGKI